MRAFAGLKGMRENVRHVVVRYGVEYEGMRKGRDWVFLLGECFVGLESVEFVVCRGRFDGVEERGVEMDVWKEKRCGGEGDYICQGCEDVNFEIWWRAVVDAMREGGHGGVQLGLRLRCLRGDGYGVEVS